MYFLDMVRHCPAIIIPDPSRAVWKPAAKLTKKLQNANKKPKNIAKNHQPPPQPTNLPPAPALVGPPKKKRIGHIGPQLIRPIRPINPISLIGLIGLIGLIVLKIGLAGRWRQLRHNHLGGGGGGASDVDAGGEGAVAGDADTLQVVVFGLVVIGAVADDVLGAGGEAAGELIGGDAILVA